MKIRIPKIIQKLSPEWTVKFRTRETVHDLIKVCKINGIYLDIQSHQFCIVGRVLDIRENRFGDYNSKFSPVDLIHGRCKTCVLFSQGFYSVIKSRSISEQTKIVTLQRNLKGFAEHIQEKHSKKIEKKLARLKNEA